MFSIDSYTPEQLQAISNMLIILMVIIFLILVQLTKDIFGGKRD